MTACGAGTSPRGGMLADPWLLLLMGGDSLHLCRLSIFRYVPLFPLPCDFGPPLSRRGPQPCECPRGALVPETARDGRPSCSQRQHAPDPDHRPVLLQPAPRRGLDLPRPSPPRGRRLRPPDPFDPL